MLNAYVVPLLPGIPPMQPMGQLLYPYGPSTHRRIKDEQVIEELHNCRRKRDLHFTLSILN